VRLPRLPLEPAEADLVRQAVRHFRAFV
jgi:hypothetical protein